MPRSDPPAAQYPFPTRAVPCVVCGRPAGVREPPLWLVRQAPLAKDDQLDCVCSWRCLQDFAATQLGRTRPTHAADRRYTYQRSDKPDEG